MFQKPRNVHVHICVQPFLRAATCPLTFPGSCVASSSLQVSFTLPGQHLPSGVQCSPQVRSQGPSPLVLCRTPGDLWACLLVQKQRLPPWGSLMSIVSFRFPSFPLFSSSSPFLSVSISLSPPLSIICYIICHLSYLSSTMKHDRDTNFSKVILFLKRLFMFRGRTLAGQGQRERERESQAGSALSAQRPMWGSKSQTLRS